MSETLPTITEREEEIGALMKGFTDAARRKPLEALLLVRSGQLRSKEAIVEHFGVTRRTVNRWIKRYVEQGARGFLTQGYTGERPAVAPNGPAPNGPAPNGHAADGPASNGRASNGHAAAKSADPSAQGLATLPAVDRAPSRASSRPLSRVAGEGSQPFVILGEGDDLVATIVEARLQREGIHTERALDGIQLVALTEERSPDLILIDIRLSGLDGYQITRWVRSHKRLQFTPVILLGWPGKETDVVEAFKAGADDYILKPFSPIDLSARIGRLLARNVAATVRSY